MAERDPRFPDLHAFCLFVGYPRSGHSLVGALLDAHPDVSIAHEANALKLVADGVSRTSLLDALLANAQAQAARPGGRKASGYSYAVPNQWQGRVRTLRVVGDKAGQKTASRLRRDPGALDRLERLLALPLRLVHVTRNPYDTIARMALTRSRSDSPRPEDRAEAIDFFGRLAQAVARLLAAGRHPVATVRYEAFVAEPRRELARLCAFLEVDAHEDYVNACAAVVRRSPRRTRDLIDWSPDDRAAVDELIASYGFLDGYRWATGDAS
jgi:hypothetical protein